MNGGIARKGPVGYTPPENVILQFHPLSIIDDSVFKNHLSFGWGIKVQDGAHQMVLPLPLSPTMASGLIFFLSQN